MVGAGRATGSDGTLPRPRPSPWPSVAGCLRVDLGRSEGVRDLDLAGHDLLLVGVDLVLDVVDLTAAGGVADTVTLEVVDVEAGLHRTVLVGLGEVEDRDVDALERRGQDVRLLVLGGGEVLVGVDTDRELVLRGSGLEDTVAGQAGGVEHDVRTVVVE